MIRPPGPDDGARERALFDAVLGVEPELREAFLRAESGGDVGLERRVLRLVAAHERAELVPPPTARPARVSVPERIGLYRIVERIGEGGMGVVYLAEQTEPIRRQVALKVVKAGMSTDEVIARFHSERQALALMEHPGIARIFDSGATDQGLPYFVMEHVAGRPLVQYCDEKQLALERRLELFVHVCRAVQHAHAKGIIHRDIKPSNLLVAEVDGRPVPKVIDFGIARAIDRSSGDAEAFTRTGGIVGTPAYMSPEQVDERTADIDTRSDVYALGVVLYELLTGALPFERQDSFGDLRRALREQDPPRPSTRLAGLGKAATTVAEQRSASPGKLATRLRGDLDWVVLKALERDRDRRYQTAESFARDVERYLANEPVTATPPSSAYLLSKFVARNRLAVFAAGFVVLALILGTIGTTIGFLRAEEQRKLAVKTSDIADEQRRLAVARGEVADEQRKVAEEQRKLAEQRAHEASIATARAVASRDFVTGMLANANPLKSLRKEVKVADLLHDASKRLDDGEFADDPDTEFELRYTLGQTFHTLTMNAEAQRELELAMELLPRTSQSQALASMQLRLDLAEVIGALDASTRGGDIATEVLAELDAAGGGDVTLRSRALQLLASARYTAGDTAEAVAIQREALALLENRTSPNQEATALVRNTLAFFLIRQGLHAEALEEVDRALAVLRVGSPSARVEAAYGLRQRGNALLGLNRNKEAEVDLLEALRIREELYDEGSPGLADLLNDLATLESLMSKFDAADEHIRRALEIRRARLGEHRDTATSLTVLANIARVRRDFPLAIQCSEEALAMRRRMFDADSPAIGDSLRRLGMVLRDSGDLAAAEPMQREGLALWRRTLGDEHPDTRAAAFELGKTLRRRGNYDEARELVTVTWEQRSAISGPRASATREARDELIGILLDLEDWPSARKVLEDTIALEEPVLPAGHVLLTYLKAQLGAVLLAEGNIEEAQPLLLAGWEAIGNRPDIFVENKLTLLTPLTKLATALGDTEGAERYRKIAADLAPKPTAR